MLVERRSQKKVVWPGGARVALLMTVDFEAEEDLHSFPNGKINYQDYSARQYGGRCGMWRLLEVFDKHDIKATVFICGAVVENYPEASKAVKERGHDVAAHTYAHEYLWRLNEEEERQVYPKARSAFERVLGERPYGWRSCFISDRSVGLTLEHGYKWDSSLWNDDLPYILEGNGRRMVEIPGFAINADVSFLGEPATSAYSTGKHGIVRDQDLAWRDEFDACYEKGAVTPTMQTICIHCYLTGRPGPSKALDDFLAYTKKFPGVWYASYSDVANWWLKQGY
jgi:peptidoglycan/xylan/chitin deacetylase (PgdA/CDA1 family)